MRHSAESRALRLYASLDALFSSTYTMISGCLQPLTADSRIYAGAAHFFVHVLGNVIYSLGDNRHFQLGTASRSSWSHASLVSFFEGGSLIKKVACGDLHNAILTEDGALYMCGSDAKGQCGGYSEQEPCLVEFSVPENEEQPDGLDVACGSNHTVVLTDKGVYVSGSSESLCVYPKKFSRQQRIMF